MVFCNKDLDISMADSISHNPYFNRWFSAILLSLKMLLAVDIVTILILIDGFLQYYGVIFKIIRFKRHNPYFNRWFSAI